MIPQKDSGLESFGPNQLVIVDQSGQPAIAQIISIDKARARLAANGTKELLIPLARLDPVAFPLGDSSAKTPAPLRREQFGELLRSAVPLADSLDLEELWQLTHEEHKEFSSHELTALLFPDPTAEKQLALRLALHADQVFFKRSRLLFTPRPLETVNELRKSAEKQRAHDKQMRLFLDGVANTSPSLERDFPEIVGLLLEVAAGASHVSSQAHKDAKRILERAEAVLETQLGKGREERALKLLSTAGVIYPNCNLTFHRYPVETDFSSEEQNEAARVAHSILQASTDPTMGIEDFSGWECFTIDDVSTRDMDDAISVHQDHDGFILGVHISDVASFIEENSPLDSVARGRGISIYCPERDVNMLPEALSHEALSLQPGKNRRVVSFLYRVSSNYEVKFERVARAIICSQTKYDYDSVDKLLLAGDGGVALQAAYNVAQTREAFRLGEGAAKIPKKEVQVQIASPSDLRNSAIQLVEIDESSPARSLIGELMILVNETVATMFAADGHALIFRSQEASQESSINQNLQGAAYDFALRMNLKRSITSAKPAPHATLGLAAYAQVTSPIRRYSDLINQRQLISSLLYGAPSQNEDGVTEIIEGQRQPLQTARQLTRDAKRFWLLRILEEKYQRREPVSGTILRNDNRGTLVELDELYMPVTVKSPQALPVGARFSFRLDRVRAHTDYLKITPLENISSCSE